MTDTYRVIVVKRAALLVVLAFLAAAQHAAFGAEIRDPLGYETVLLPINIDVRATETGLLGAYGSRWTMEFFARNNGPQPVQIFPRACVFFCSCPVFPCPNLTAVPASALFDSGLIPVGPTDGVLLHVQRSGADQMSYGLRVRELSQPSLTLGTELPVVREKNFRSGTMELLNVPTAAGYRALLRLYRLDLGTAAARMAIRVVPNGDGQLISDATVELPPYPNAGSVAMEDYQVPSMRRVDLSDLLSRAGSSASVRIEIVPDNAAVVFWAYISVTNNATQLVTLITPSN